MAFFSVRRTAVLVCGVAAILGAGSAQAALVDLNQYNAFILGNYDGYYSDVQGRLAAGGNVGLNGYSVGSGLNAAANGTSTLVVGGNLTATNGQLFRGNAVVGGTSSVNGFTIANGSVGNGSVIDFAQQGLLVGALADSLGAMGSNGSAVKQWGGIYLTGAQSDLNVFTLQASDFTGANNFVINAPTGSKVLVNVAGGAATLQNMGFSVNGASASDVLLNFYEAGSLNLGGIGIFGSILAPDAAVNFSNGQMNGLLVAASFKGSGELHNTGYTGGLLHTSMGPVPEPATWAMMIAGFGLVGASMRRARRKDRLALA